LRARRERLRPEDVGIAVGDGHRRVVGLRREEVAILAGISTDYYLRLEQGRDLNPSHQVLDALARALLLDGVATNYLHELAHPHSDTHRVDRGDVVDDNIVWLIDSWPLTAAFVHSRHSDVLAANALARALNPNHVPGSNSLISLFRDPSARDFYVDWEGITARSVALLRSRADGNSPHTRLDELVAEGTAASPRFREFWERRDVIALGHGVHVLRHPRVGELCLNFVHLPLVGTDGQSIFAYNAEPGTPSEAALRLLAERG
jgi:transcriptional regulator with XRE-family HTH domain